MKRNIKTALIVALIAALAIMFSGCGDSGDSGEKEYVKASEIEKVLSSPDDYEGKYIKIPGKVFSKDKDDDITAIQCWYDVEHYEKSFIAYTENEVNVSNDDYVIVDGRIEGEFTGENAFGGEVGALSIEADKIKKSTYQEAIAPAKKVKKVNKKKTQYGVTFKVRKVEFADKETRIYVKVINKSKYDVSIYTNSAKVIQAGKQYDIEYNGEADYPSIDEVAGEASKTGIICVKALDPDKKVKVKVDPYSDNYEIDMKPFVIRF